MFITVQAHEYEKHADLLQQMFRLRKVVFADKLQWDVPVDGDIERDVYDQFQPVYVLWCSNDQKTLFGSIRLMPTTGPTLLHDVFHRTIPAGASLVAPSIWEATRCCVDSDALALHHPEIDQSRAFGLICLAAAEVAQAHGISTLISNYEPHMRRVYARSGAQIEEIGRADGYGRRPVCCGAFEISGKIVTDMRAALNIDIPLYTRRFTARTQPSELAA